MKRAAKATRTAAQRNAKPLFSGKRADLIVFKGNLSAYRKALKDLQWTMKDGVACDSPRISAAV
jgi:imidazolonepropionase-like amidohydrolase